MSSTTDEVVCAATDPEGASAKRNIWPNLPLWLPGVALLVLVALTALQVTQPIHDPDTWWHLRLGEEFRGAWSLSDPGSLSSFATRPWFATQWTLEVVASYLTDTFGVEVVSWMTGVGVLALAVALYAASRPSSSVLAASTAVGLGLIGTFASLSPRPQVASFILAAVVMGAWLRTERDLRPRWWLIPLSWLWACTHGMWVVGPLIGTAAVVGMLLDRSIRVPAAAKLLSIPLLSVGAAMVTPVGPKLLGASLYTSQMAPFVTEWQPPDFTSPTVATTAIMLATVVVLWSRSARGTSWTQILLLLLAAAWTVYAARTVALGAVMATPLMSSALMLLPGIRRARVSQAERRAVASGTLIILALLTFATPSLAAGSSDSVPSRLDNALAALPPGTAVFNEYTLGGWLTWEHRHLDPVIDGMTDAYPVEHMRAWVDAMKLRDGWATFVAGTGAEYALLEDDAPLAIELNAHLNWEIVEEDPAGFVLLRRPD